MHVVVAPGASVVTGHETVPAVTSAIETPVSVTLPVLATRNVYGSVEPAVAPVRTPACLSRLRLGAAAIGESVESVPVTAAPVGGVADTVAVLAM